jgi:ABC-type Fe3+-hydroxamate transport system substrate-binding protein
VALVAALWLGVAHADCRTLVTLSPALGRVAFEVLGEKGAQGRLVGVSSHTDLPTSISMTEVSGLARIDFERIVGLRPDCVFYAPGVISKGLTDRLRRLLRAGVPASQMIEVPMESLTEISEAYRSIGVRLGRQSEGAKIASEFTAGLVSIRHSFSGKRVLVQIQEHPLIVLGGRRTFLSDAFAHLGVQLVFSDLDEPYPRVSLEAALARHPEEVWILGEPGDERARLRRQAPWVKRGIRVRTLPAEQLSQPTARVLDGLKKVVADVGR